MTPMTKAYAMPAENMTWPPLGGQTLLFAVAGASGSFVLELFSSPVFATNLGRIVTLGVLIYGFWEAWNNRDVKKLKQSVANLQAVNTANQSVIGDLQRASELGRLDRVEMLHRLDKASLDLAQAKLEILRSKGVLAYSSQRIPVRPATPPERLHILVVEDDESTRHSMAKVIGHYGYQITLAESVAEALEQIRRRERVGPRFDFAILDLILPDGSGMEVLEALQSSSKTTDAIVISGSIDEVVLAKTQSAAVAFLVKPVEFAELLSLLGIEHKPSAAVDGEPRR